MKIQHKITLVSSVLFGIIFFIAAVVIYTSFNTSSNNIFYKELSRTAKIAGMFYLEKDELSKTNFQPIEKAFYNLSSEQQISIFNEQGEIAFDTENQSRDLSSKLKQVRKRDSLNFKKGDSYYHGLFYKDNQGDFVVLVKAENPLIQSQLKNLLLILLLSFIIAMLVLVSLTSWLSKLAYKPVRHTIKQVNTLDLNQKPLKLNYKSTNDELEELFGAFNGLLKEIEHTYQQQKNFVDYASHELKTPLAGIINELEISLQRQRSDQEYQETSQMVLQDAVRLQTILKNLLTLSSLNRTFHQKKTFRVDELIWEVIEQLSKKYGSNKFHVDFLLSSKKFDLLKFNGSESLLYIAFLNFMENAAKFSVEKPVNISLEEKNHRLKISITDQGIGINEEDLQKIAQPFYRAQNAFEFDGNGLGFSIALRIIKLHHVVIDIDSTVGKGTKIVLEFPGTQN